jgi:hypothetical protein
MQDEYTAMARGNLGATVLDLAGLNDGDVIGVLTTRSRWAFVLPVGRKVRRDVIKGVAVMTSSRSFGQVTSPVMEIEIDRVFRLGERISINGGYTSPVQTITINGERRLG